MLRFRHIHTYGFWLAVLMFAGLFLTLYPSESEGKRVYVRGYYRSDGTYVRPHYRTVPDSNPLNNYSTPGNYNPNTGRVTTGNLNTYLNRYNTRQNRSQLNSGLLNTRRNKSNLFNTRRNNSVFNTRQSNSVFNTRQSNSVFNTRQSNSVFNTRQSNSVFNTRQSNSNLFNTRVRGHQRRSGTYVSPYYRTRADSNPLNNYSTPGNYNLNTGRTTTGNINSYLNRYYTPQRTSTGSNSLFPSLNIYSTP